MPPALRSQKSYLRLASQGALVRIHQGSENFLFSYRKCCDRAVDWERYSQDLLDQEGKLDERFSAWMDEYGGNIHHWPVLEVLSMEKTPHQQTSPAYADRMDELDQLYDQQMLMDEFFEESPAEMYP